MRTITGVATSADGSIPGTGAAGSVLDGELSVSPLNNKVILPSGGTATFQVDVIPPPR